MSTLWGVLAFLNALFLGLNISALVYWHGGPLNLIAIPVGAAFTVWSLVRGLSQ